MGYARRMSNLKQQSGSAKAIVLLVVVALAAGAGWFVVFRDDAGDDARETDAPRISSNSGLEEEEFVEEKWGTEVVRIERVSEVQGEERSYVQIYFTSDLEGFAIAQKADQCARSYLKEFDSASCYGFPNVEAVEYAGVDPETGEMEHICWLGFASRAAGGEKVIRVDNGQFEAEGCPA